MTVRKGRCVQIELHVTKNRGRENILELSSSSSDGDATRFPSTICEEVSWELHAVAGEASTSAFTFFSLRLFTLSRTDFCAGV